MEKTPTSVLLVTPHQDDAEGGCGGIVAKWAMNGAKVVYVLCTNGDKGSNDPSMTSVELAKIREIEQQKAADVLGVEEIVFLRHPDGELEDTYDVRAEVVREIRRHKPEIVMCLDPFRRISHSHRDHRISGLLALDAVFTYSWSPHHFPDQITNEGLSPHRVSQMYFWGSELSDTYFDISDTLDLKIAALAEHESQMPKLEEIRARTIRRAENTGENGGVKFYAEAFRKLEIDNLLLHWAEF